MSGDLIYFGSIIFILFVINPVPNRQFKTKIEYLENKIQELERRLKR